jgi:hypothetical protein
MSQQPNRTPPGPAGALTALAREIETLRRRIDALHDLPSRVDELAHLTARVADELAAHADCCSAPGAAPSWLALPADSDAHALLEQLMSWLAAVYLRYPDAFLPECWLWHPAVIEELLWLMSAWTGAYQGESAAVAQAGDWHDRYRPGVARRIRDAVGRCSLERHQPRDQHEPADPPPAVPLAAAAAELATWWATSRTSPPPPPCAEHVTDARRHRNGQGGSRR